ncbi:hypothetical protein Tco_1362919 [Tanacetum coccineum]
MVNFITGNLLTIVYDDALSFESDFSSKTELNYELIDNVNLENYALLPEYLFSYKIPPAINLQLDKGNDDDKIGVKQFSRNIFVDTYGDENVETSIPFDPKQFYKDGAYTNIAKAKVHWVHLLDFDVLTKDMGRDLTERLRMEHTDAKGQVLFTSYAWRALLGIRGLDHGECSLFAGVKSVQTCFEEEAWAPNVWRSLYFTIGCAFWGDYRAEPPDFDFGDPFADVVTWVALGLQRQQVGVAQVDPKDAVIDQEIMPDPTLQDAPQVPEAVALAPRIIP